MGKLARAAFRLDLDAVPLCEPVPITTTFVDGGDFYFSGGMMRIAYWAIETGPDGLPERRLVDKVVMTEEAMRAMVARFVNQHKQAMNGLNPYDPTLLSLGSDTEH